MAESQRASKRQRGSIDELPSGALRVRVYAGVDPVTRRRLDLTEIIPPGPQAEKHAEAARVRMLNEVYERRHPRTDATVTQLLERHLTDANLGFKTRKNYRGQVNKHVIPYIGNEKVRAIDAAITDSLYAELRRCRDHCDGRPGVDHRTPRKHECDSRCRPHACMPLEESSVLYLHQILSGAFRRAVRLKWVSVNPFDNAEPPPAPKPRPRPPSVAEAARIVSEAWKDPDWGMLIWLTMVAGNRRGELCGIRWRNLDLNARVLHVQRAIGQYGALTWEKNTKNDADRRIVLDGETVLLLTEHRDRCLARARAIGVELADDAFVFSQDPDGAAHLKPDSVGQRYGRLAKRLGIKTSLHKLRAYNATELIAAGVDIRTVAGRLGHGSGGATTLRSYTAWVSEADQRAAGEMATRMPARPVPAAPPTRVEIDPKSPFEKIAVELRDRIYDGEFAVGLPMPSVKQLARQHGVSSSTAQRAVQLLGRWGLVMVEPGRPTLVSPRPMPTDGDLVVEAVQPSDQGPQTKTRSVDLEVRRLGATVAILRTRADPSDADVLHRLLVGAVKRDGRQPLEIDDYELVVRAPGNDTVLMTYVAMSP